jgi:hypothetical protein
MAAFTVKPFRMAANIVALQAIHHFSPASFITKSSAMTKKLSASFWHIDRTGQQHQDPEDIWLEIE